MIDMADVFDTLKRSEIMARVRSVRNKSTELKMARFLRGHGIHGWRRNVPLQGKPDFVFRGPRLALFVDGCFWHGCPLHCRQPSSNVDFWQTKIERNMRRDRIVTRMLRAKRWKVMRVWEHELLLENAKALKARFARRNIF